MKKIFIILFCLFAIGCEKGTAISRTKITETTHLRSINVNSGGILELELIGPPQQWNNVKNCEDYEVMFVGHGQRVRNPSRFNAWKEDVEIIYLKPKRSFIIDWKYRGPSEISENIEGKTWFHVEICVK